MYLLLYVIALSQNERLLTLRHDSVLALPRKNTNIYVGTLIPFLSQLYSSQRSKRNNPLFMVSLNKNSSSISTLFEDI